MKKSTRTITKALREYFDAEFYMRQLKAEKSSTIDPVFHYVKKGWAEGLDPSRDFSRKR
ncbi:MAG: hypothetical protein JKX71_05890 [Amylibacter sp.]|nr:hypothetical protein [Amylibacter sp.]